MKGATLSFLSACSRSTHQFDKRYFRQRRFVYLLFLILRSLSLLIVAALDEVEFEHFVDGGGRHHIFAHDRPSAITS